MSNHFDTLIQLISQVRRRWRLKSILRGLAVCSGAALLLFCIAVFLGRLFNFNDPAVWTLRILAVGLFGVVAVIFLILPGLRRVSDGQVARFIEENDPSLEQRLSSAVEFGSDRKTALTDLLLRRLIEDALTRCHRIDYRELIHPRAIFSYALATAIGFLILVGILSFGPSYVPYGAARLFAGWTKAADELPFKIHVIPGNATVQRGSDQPIRVTFEGFAPERAQIFSRRAGAQTWSAAEMQPQRSGNSFKTLMQNLLADREYFVEAGGFKSDSYRIKVEDLPRVTQIDLTYDFPKYTGLPAQHLENQGNISALYGTRVRVSASLSMPVTGAKLLLNNGHSLEMETDGDLLVFSQMTLKTNGSYVIQLSDQRGEWRVASDEYEIEVLEDQAPTVTIQKPGRDYRATRIEEVYVESKAVDDLRIAGLQLHFIINGGEEQVVPLYTASGSNALKTVIIGHTFFFEEMPLKVGDVISYYAEATDGNPRVGAKAATSDMFFIEISSFDKSYSRAEGRGQGGRSGGGARALTKRQKEIIAATWRLIRERNHMNRGEFSESVRSVALIQGRLREQTSGLAETISSRLGSIGNSEMVKLGKMLERASEEMEEAETALSKQNLKEALPFEQAALTKLMEAENFYKDVQLQFSQSNDPGSQAAANWEDLSDLFELEMDRIKNQYETLRQDAARKREERVDEALRRLRELAQRQEQFVERQRRMQAQRAGQGSASSGGTNPEALQRQQELAEQTEQLRRQLEQLAREKPENRMPEVSRRLQQATRQMQKSLQEMRSSNKSNASMAGTKALQELQEAERLMDSARIGKSEKTLEQLRKSVRSLQADETKIQQEVDRLASKSQELGAARTKEAKGRVISRKDMMVEKLDDLEAELSRAARELDSQQRAAGKQMARARSAIREKRIRDKILDGKGFIDKGWFDFAKAREDNIARDLEGLNALLARAEEQLGSKPSEKLLRALNQTRDLVDSLESLKNRLAQQGKQAAEGDSQKQEQSQQAGRQSEQQQSQALQQGQRGGQSQGQRPEQQQGQGQQRGQRGGQGQRQGRQQQRQGGTDENRSLRNQTITGGAAPVGRSEADSKLRRLTPQQLRQLRREYEERLKQAQGIVPDLKGNPELSVELTRLLSRMRSLYRDDLGVRPENISQLQTDVLDPLKQFEVELSRRINEMSARNKLHLLSEDDVPPGFRKMVEEYFKKIAVKK